MWDRHNPNCRALLFGVVAAMAGVGASRVATGLNYKMHKLFDFHTVVQAGVWGDLGVAVASFALGTLICRGVVRTFPPTAGPCIGLPLMTSMAILLALSIGTGLGVAIKSRDADFVVFSFTFSLMYTHFTTLPTLIVLMGAGMGIWLVLCSEEATASSPSSSSRPLPIRNIKARYRVWVPPKDLRIIAPRWWLALTFGDDSDTSSLRRTQTDALQNGGERKDRPSAAT